MTKVIGITGFIGSGKTTVCKKIANKFGLKIFYSDDQAKSLYENKDVQKEVLDLLGTLDKKEIAEIVFNDEEKLESLTNIFKHRVKSLFNNFLKVNNKEDYVLYESAILLKDTNLCDNVIVVYADKETCLKRASNRDNTTNEKIEERYTKQRKTIIENLHKATHFICTDNKHGTTNDGIYEIINEIING